MERQSPCQREAWHFGQMLSQWWRNARGNRPMCVFAEIWTRYFVVIVAVSLDVNGIIDNSSCFFRLVTSQRFHAAWSNIGQKSSPTV